MRRMVAVGAGMSCGSGMRMRGDGGGAVHSRSLTSFLFGGVLLGGLEVYGWGGRGPDFLYFSRDLVYLPDSLFISGGRPLDAAG